jgi:hypothetical protein
VLPFIEVLAANAASAVAEPHDASRQAGEGESGEVASVDMDHAVDGEIGPGEPKRGKPWD